MSAPVSAGAEGGQRVRGPLGYTLLWPVDVCDATGGLVEKLTQLQLHRLNGADMEAMKMAGGGAAMVEMVARSARLPLATVRQMDAEDLIAAGGMVADFLGGSLPTGAK